MHHRQIPHDLKERVRKYDQYRWATTHGVDEEAILQHLLLDLQRDIKRHLCLDLVRQVSLFDQMDEHMLDAICERLKPMPCTPRTCLVCKSDLVGKMLFIIRGHLESYSTNGGRTGFFSSCRLGPDDFCGEELLSWALAPRQRSSFPSSTHAVKVLTKVEAFALRSEDVNYVESKFWKLHSKKLKNNSFRCLSHQWRTWAACFRYKRCKQSAFINAIENAKPSCSSGLTLSRSNSMTLRGKKSIRVLELGLQLEKPVDPDFTLMDV